jgi:hypothetical protein
MIHFAEDHGVRFSAAAVEASPVPATAPGMVAA